MISGRVIRKYYDYIVTKFKVLREQKVYKFDEINLKYIYKTTKKQADTLVVVFSACTRPGLKARYNYVKTLDGLECNRLYILDDFGYDHRGSYYLGHMPEFREQEATVSLVQKVIKEMNPKRVIFCGSCKGGYAALNIGSRFENASIIIGEPTYRIATEFKLAEGLMQYWMGTVTEENVKYVDEYLENQLKKNPYISNQKIFFFYSEKDEYVKLHTNPLLQVLHETGYRFETEPAQFEAHADLGLYFPDYLKKKVQQHLENREETE